MGHRSISLITADEVSSLLRGRERAMLDAVRAAYEAHARSETAVPPSAFLQFPGNNRDRIVALPAFLGEPFNIAGMKWVASFPDNVARGINRATAVVILNSVSTGVPRVIMEGSLISACRTAASAALAAQTLCAANRVPQVGIIGCGPINFETTKFLSCVFPELSAVSVYDKDTTRAELFAKRCERLLVPLDAAVEKGVASVLSSSDLLFIATTAVAPHILDLSVCRPHAAILHVSLRDLTVEAILSADNVVDDPDHVCRAHTSVHLAEQAVGNREFIRCTLGDILLGQQPARTGHDRVCVFSPFGLGILDLVIAELVRKLAEREGKGAAVEAFLAPAWDGRTEHSRDVRKRC